MCAAHFASQTQKDYQVLLGSKLSMSVGRGSAKLSVFCLSFFLSFCSLSFILKTHRHTRRHKRCLDNLRRAHTGTSNNDDHDGNKLARTDDEEEESAEDNFREIDSSLGYSIWVYVNSEEGVHEILSIKGKKEAA